MKRSSWALVVLATFTVSGCSAIKGCGVVKDFRKSRHLKAAEGYDADKKYKEATIEYRNALRFDPQDLQTVKKLAFAYYENGQIGEAFPPLQRYVDENPNDLEARQKLGTIYLMGRAPDKAREQAETILAKQPDDLDALLLLAESAETPEQIKDAIARLEAKRATLGDPDRVARALGVLYARNKDLPRAEQEFQAAVTSKPDSPDAHLALARLHLGKRELARGREGVQGGGRPRAPRLVRAAAARGLLPADAPGRRREEGPDATSPPRRRTRSRPGCGWARSPSRRASSTRRRRSSPRAGDEPRRRDARSSSRPASTSRSARRRRPWRRPRRR